MAQHELSWRTALLNLHVVVLLGLERAGHLWHVSDRECEDYMHLWRLIGHWLGLPAEITAQLDCVASSQRLLESILPHIIDSMRAAAAWCLQAYAQWRIERRSIGP